MMSQSFNPFSSDYRNAFGNSYIRQFDVYVSPEEKIGRIAEVRVDSEGHLQDIVVVLEAPENRQVIVPLNRTQIDQQRQRVYIHGLSKAEVMNFPAYESSRVSGAPPTHTTASVEASVPLGDRSRYATAPVSPPAVSQTPSTVTHGQLGEGFDRGLETSTQPDQGTTIRLHEERLVVDHNKRRKVGEVIVRKEIETRMIEVPVRHEKLIVEQISPAYEQLAVVNLEPNRTNPEDIAGDRLPARASVSGDFTSAEAASRFLDAIAHHPNAGHEKIQIRIILREGTDQATYQQWLERYLG